ncbi:hypothetical protein GTO89_03420 [Heliobacterium gestii]|uniref:HPt domain-containing protein n=1 Tax=Heliomicrobium gestii TaxID=2699 RepID=A0A845LC59_HELGE|nr:Hpt domain-containing protein [Heliomicrobium gestii]MBM7865844.1 HPt (histidine-containing phosphotransfer) domain-containing protein [Heliomicrobium gestii]MZP42085.1 hypothetical protein [Heliomicrobium gestii]
MQPNSPYDFHALFFDESLEMLAAASAALLAAEESGEPSQAVPEVFRAFHSIKGGAQSLDFDDLARFAHRMEDWLDPFRRGKAAGTAMVNILLETMDRMEMGLTGLRAGDLDTGWAEEQRRYLKTLEATGDRVVEKASAQPGGDKGGPTSRGEIANPSMEESVTAVIAKTNAEDREPPAAAVAPVSLPGDRVLCLRIGLVADAPMPEVRHVLIQERLKPACRILDCRCGEGSDHPLFLVVSTEQSDEAIRRLCDVGDVAEVALRPVNEGLFSGVDQLVAAAGVGPVRVALIDISHREILEAADLRRLSEARSALARKGTRLGLISKGPFMRRHLNILEAAALLTGELPVYTDHVDAGCGRWEDKDRPERRTRDVSGNESAAD